MTEKEPWETDEEEYSTVQEGGDILFEDPPQVKLKFHDYEG